MKILPSHLGPADSSAALVLPRDPDRSSGLHLSAIIRSIALIMGYLKPEYADQDESAASFITKVALGSAWEDWLFRHQHHDVCYHPGEVVRDGIAMSVDGVSFAGAAVTVHECKLTWKSSRRDLSAEWMWLAQTKAYCLAWNTHRARWHIYWVNDNYSHDASSGPRYRTYDLEFTDTELRENWRMILGHARDHFKLGKARS